MSAKQTPKSCFIVTPIGPDGSEIRRAIDGLLEAVLRPVLESEGYECKAAHEIAAPGSISRDVITRLVNSDLVVANLTGLNPNVMYELAIRHCAKKPVISIAERETDLPFDVTDQRVIPFSGDMAGVEPLKKDLKRALLELSQNPSVDNPVTSAVQSSLVDLWVKSDSPKKGDFERFVLEELREIRSMFNFQNQKVPPPTDPFRKKFRMFASGFTNQLIKFRDSLRRMGTIEIGGSEMVNEKRVEILDFVPDDPFIPEETVIRTIAMTANGLRIDLRNKITVIPG